MSLFGDEKVLGGIDILLHEGFHLVFEDVWLNQDSVADDVQLGGMKDAGRDDVKNVLRAIEFYGVACIGASLETCNYIIIGREDIDNLAFTLITPLETEKYVYFAHSNVTYFSFVISLSYAKIRLFFELEKYFCWRCTSLV